MKIENAKTILTMAEMKAVADAINHDANAPYRGGVAQVEAATYYWDNRFSHWRLIKAEVAK